MHYGSISSGLYEDKIHMSFLLNIFRRDNSPSKFGELGYGTPREDNYLNPYTTFRKDFRAFGETSQANLWASINDPIANRMTYGVARDVVFGWFTIRDKDKKPHDANKEIQEKLQKLHAKDKLTLLATYNEAIGRAWIIRKGKGDKEEWLTISDHNLVEPRADSFDEDGKPTTINVKMEFTAVHKKTSSMLGDPFKPKDYVFYRTRPYDLTSRGRSIIGICREDLKFIWNMKKDTAERIRKYAGFPHIIIQDGNDSLIAKYKRRYGDFNKLREIWSNQGMEIKMLGLEGSSINPDYYYKPFIEQISIATGIPIPILRGAESGQLKSGQINLSSYYSVVSNHQQLLTPIVEQLIEWVEPGVMDEAVIDWNLEYAYSDMDVKAMQQIQVEMAVALRPHINDEAFAKLLFDVGITEKDIEEQPMKMFGGGGFDDEGEGGEPSKKSPFESGMNPIKEEAGRKAGEKKNPIVRSGS